MSRIALSFGALSGLVAVILGAFGAHALEGVLTPGDLSTWKTAVLYQFVHSLALLIVGVWSLARPGPALRFSSWAFIAGIVVFSGSLYLLVATDTRWLGAITPLGGAGFILGWMGLFFAARQSAGE